MGWDGMDSWRWCASDSDSKTMNEEQRLRANVVVVRWNVSYLSSHQSIYLSINQSIDWKLPSGPLSTLTSTFYVHDEQCRATAVVAA